MARFGLACGVLGFACAVACSKPAPTTKPGDFAAPSASAISSAPAAASPSAATTVPHLAPVKPECRALVVTGRATVDAAPIAAGDLLDGLHWVDLEAGSSVALRHTLTSREFKLIGPGRVLPCRNGSEQLLLAAGRLSTSANLGVRPGAEVLIASPSGTVHYGDAALDVELAAGSLRVRVKQGEAWVEPEARGKPHFKNPVQAGKEAHLLPEHSAPQALIDACQAAAEAAADSARHVLETGAGGGEASLGVRAAAHMRDRSKARTACAIAAAGVGASSDPAERQSLSASVAHFDELWQSVPHAGSGQKN